MGPDAASRYPVGHPNRLVLPGEPVETDYEDNPLTSDLRAILLNNLATNEDTDEDYENCLEYSAITVLMELNSMEIMAETGRSLGSSAGPLHSPPAPAPVMLATVRGHSQDHTTKHRSNIVTWDDVRNATAADPTIQTILQLLATGFPDDARTLPATIRPYHPLSSSLYELDGVLMLSDRIVVPTSLRPAILNLLHAAH